MNETERARAVFTEMVRRSGGALMLEKMEGRASKKGFPDYTGVWDGEGFVLECKVVYRHDATEALQHYFLDKFAAAGGLAIKVKFNEKRQWATITALRKDALRKSLQKLQCELDACLPRGWNVSIRFVNKFIEQDLLPTEGR